MTPRQSQALKFIGEFVRANGYSPSYDEIAAHLGLKSKAGVYRLVKALLRQGRLAQGPHESNRAIYVVPTPERGSRLVTPKMLARWHDLVEENPDRLRMCIRSVMSQLAEEKA